MLFRLLSALMCFVMNIDMDFNEAAIVQVIEENSAKHIAVVNDIYSFDKELRKAQSGHREGSVLCNAVRVLAEEMGISDAAARRTLWTVCRQWEARHYELVDEIQREPEMDPRKLAVYLKGVEYQMSGNERNTDMESDNKEV
ncbi:MAG: hypothetical protein Q9159_006303 [Coniocarpon cinnabarinum]